MADNHREVAEFLATLKSRLVLVPGVAACLAKGDVIRRITVGASAGLARSSASDVRLVFAEPNEVAIDVLLTDGATGGERTLHLLGTQLATGITCLNEKLGVITDVRSSTESLTIAVTWDLPRRPQVPVVEFGASEQEGVPALEFRQADRSHSCLSTSSEPPDGVPLAPSGGGEDWRPL